MLTIGRLLVICSCTAGCWNRYGGTLANCWWSAVLLQTAERDTVEHRQTVGDLQFCCRLLKQIQWNIAKLLVICSSVADCWNRYSGTLQTVGDLQFCCRLLKQIEWNIGKLLVICSSITDCWRWLQPELKVCSVQVSFVDVTSLFSGTVSIIHIASHKQRCLFKTSTVDPITLLCSCHGGLESIGPVCFWNILPVIKGWFTCGH